MDTRRLGRQGLEVSALGLGCMGMTAFYRTGADPAECEATLLEAVDRGVTLFDTAEVYGPYTNECLLGRVLGGARRDRVVLATKFGFELGDQATPIRGLDSRPEHVREVVEQSLVRLQTDRIDLLYQHRVDPAVPIEDVVGAMAALVQAGKVRYLGLSEASPATLRRAHSVHPISALQSEYSLWERGVERSVLPACRELGIGLVPYSPLGRGFLAGQRVSATDLPEGDARRGHPRFQPGNYAANLRLLEKLEDVAGRHGATPGQVALAWLLAQGSDVVPIFGTTRRERLRENLGAVAVRLASGDQFLLDQVFAPGSVAGDRYPEAALAMLDRDEGDAESGG
ncbi:MAG TPA: aldo/keto reductase [Steroidobacteraceae bacterium]|nr:aldo/keto reductase [Steroidobacteraceae bacterium]